MSLFSCVSDIM